MQKKNRTKVSGRKRNGKESENESTGEHMARPPKELDQGIFEELCKIQCTESEICRVMHVTDKTLTRWCKRTYKMSFSETYKNFRVDGLVSLRRMQFKTAESGNVTMQIWLGKQLLNQAEKPAVNNSSENDISDEVEALLSELEME